MDQDNKENDDEMDLGVTRKDCDTDIKFEEGIETYASYPGTAKSVQWILKYSGGLIKDEKQANYVLIGFVLVTVIIVLFITFGGSSNHSTSGTIPANQFVPQ